ncbi:hypothetical protein EHM82_02720 [bacterium]|nr:MAG: hypothetical protein EHM82_02720 [bacterium]
MIPVTPEAPAAVATAPPPPPPVPVAAPPAARVDSGETLARAASPLPPLPPRPAPAPDRTLDQVILEYLTNEADQEQLVLLLEEESNLGLGKRAELLLRASSSKSGHPVTGAQVSVRMISTVSEPRVLAAGRTDERGLLPLAFEVPQLGRGTSALIITAVSAIGRAELKHLL